MKFCFHAGKTKISYSCLAGGSTGGGGREEGGMCHWDGVVINSETHTVFMDASFLKVLLCNLSHN